MGLQASVGENNKPTTGLTARSLRSSPIKAFCAVFTPQLVLQGAEGGLFVLNAYEAVDDAQLLSPHLLSHH